MRKFLVLFTLIFAVSYTAADDIYSFCNKVTCPYSTTNDGNQFSVNCPPTIVNGPCQIIYSNTKGQIAHSSMYLSDADSLIWVNSNLLEIQHPVSGMGTIDSVFINFNTMKISDAISSTFAVNPNKLVVFSFYYQPIIRAIFNPNKMIKIKADFSSNNPDSIITPDTHFDQDGNLVLVYYSGPNYDAKSEIISLDYKKLGVNP